ncbi:DNA-binding protein HU-alpha [Pseudorhodobacter antarcticus]|jgi:DNA-binding protein HU-alpha|uniref:DNA-binding protein HU-alpha n=1 Tax=Pseudorhodobacter antarcticus TaxID=1077947 RepID=A0A1H8LB13_9RHOB|nr:HU family DNA-binding protein [Pseudorhodobacter antarcticus]SEO02317.1 DNA-binding protein HU-alpha [Pseudorhodobacter antarcticus]
MATPKTAAAKPKSAKPVETRGPQGVPAPSIKPAAVVVAAVSVVGAPPAMTDQTANADSDSAQAPMLKKQALVDRVVTATGAKKKDVKLILEAALGVLGDALSAGEELNLPPLGKVKVNRQKTEGGAEVLILKLRRGGGKVGAAQDPNEGVAEDDEDD